LASSRRNTWRAKAWGIALSGRGVGRGGGGGQGGWGAVGREVDTATRELSVMKAAQIIEGIADSACAALP